MENRIPFYVNLGEANQKSFPPNSTPLWVALNPLTLNLQYEQRQSVEQIATSEENRKSVGKEIPVIRLMHQEGTGYYLIGTEERRVLPRQLAKFRALVYSAMPEELRRLLPAEVQTKYSAPRLLSAKMHPLRRIVDPFCQNDTDRRDCYNLFHDEPHLNALLYYPPVERGQKSKPVIKSRCAYLARAILFSLLPREHQDRVDPTKRKTYERPELVQSVFGQPASALRRQNKSKETGINQLEEMALSI